ncbi:NRAMP family divalent metal transporter [Ktedonobacter racemifer]|uniref:Mn2+/Fe2+ transporter n=1 Tax=Ktedonobacter racemifer DSM 44963 TaxID=485913 RepID=D6TBF3_KTERA|nr:NRAMP family divalent metal transporter [Ktedonobacter racemifer]EFH87937.1 Mn2+/Fe2+ transporter [Ktedonobacter racemifer DSM 44963]
MSLMKDMMPLDERNEMHTAHLDEAHIGDIQGAWGTIRRGERTPRRTWGGRLITLLVIMGPGLITTVGDNDAGGVQTYLQAGQNYGTSLLWTLLILIPVLIVNQEMVVRLGAVTGVGHARLIFERFGTFWGAFSVGDLFLLNFLTIVTEFIGFSMALQYFGVSPFISVPVGVVGLIAITATGSFRRWESAMWLCALVSFLMIPLAFIPHPAIGPVVRDTFLPGIRGGVNSTALLTIIAIVGTTVAPWQLFFQQSNIIDKRLTSRWIKHERADTIIGSFITNITAGGLIVAAAFAFTNTPFDNNFVDVLTSAQGMAHLGYANMGAIVAIILLNASIVGACAVTLSTSYAFGDVFKVNHSLHRKVREAKLFYGSYAGLVALAGAIVLIPHAPLGLLTLAVQALAGILLPSATVFLVLLCNDRAVLGPWVNKPWLNAIAAVIVGTLVVLSLILATTTFFTLSDADTVRLATGLGITLVIVLIAMGVVTLVQRIRKGPDPELVALERAEKETWQMPPLQELTTPIWSATRKVGMLTLRIYLIVAVILMVVKVIQLALGH